MDKKLERYTLLVQVKAENLAQATEILETRLTYTPHNESNWYWPGHDPEIDVLGPDPKNN